MADLRRTYGCRVRNSFTQRILATSGMAQLILAESAVEPGGSGSSSRLIVQAQLLHSIDQVTALDSEYTEEPGSAWPLAAGRHAGRPTDPSDHHEVEEWREHLGARAAPPPLVLPCAVRAPPSQLITGRWLYQDAPGAEPARQSGARPVALEQWAATKSVEVSSWTDQQQQHAANRSRRAGAGPGAISATRIHLGPTYLAIEWPRRALSGRYIFQIGAGDQAAKTMCDISVIIRQPIKLRMEPVLGSGTAAIDQLAAVAAARGPYEAGETGGWLAQATKWLAAWSRAHVEPAGRKGGARRPRRQANNAKNRLLEEEPTRIQVRAAGSVPVTPIVRVGDRLQLDCIGSGHPIDSVRWFRDGRLINTQSSSDFQTEISAEFKRAQELDHQEPAAGQWQSMATDYVQDTPAPEAIGGLGGQRERLLSSLLIRQLQPRDSGLIIFECFVQNSLGDRARAAASVLVLERHLLEWARRACPVRLARNASALAPADNDEHEGQQDDTDSLSAYLHHRQDNWGSAAVLAAFRRQNPVRTALLIEGEQAELVCPLAAAQWDQSAAGRVEWLKWTGE